MQRVSMMRMSSSRATTAAGTRPPRVTATMPLKGPASTSRQASALALRWSSSQVTGKFFCGTLLMLRPPKAEIRSAEAGVVARAGPGNNEGGGAPSSRQRQGQGGDLARGRAQLVEDREVVGAGDRQQR